MINKLNGIYNTAMNITPFKGVITFEDVLEYGKLLFDKNQYDK